MNAPKIRFHKDGPFDINEDLAGVVPMALNNEQVALMSDIEENEQRDPIVLYRGKVVDGRCRMKALDHLGKNYMYKELDNDLTEEDVKIYVKSVNTRRNLTLTQKLTTACKDYLKNEGVKSVKKTAESWGVGAPSLNNALFIAKHMPNFIDPLFNGLSVEIVDKHGNTILSNKITAVFAYVKRIIENASKKEPDHAWSANAAIYTQVGKEWFYDFIKKHNIQNTEVLIALADSANYKFTKK